MTDDYKIEVGRRLRELRNYFDITQFEFGSHIGVTKKTIISWEKGTTSPTDAQITVIAKHFHSNERWITTGRGKMISQEIPEAEDGVRVVDQRLMYLRSDSASMTEVSVWTLAGVGNAYEGEDYEPIDRIELPTEFITIDGKVLGQAVKAEGDSMYPTIVDKGLVGVDFQDKKLVDNGLFLIRFPDVGLAIKRLQITTKGVTVVSDNKQVPTEEIDKSVLKQNFVVGRIKWIHNKL